MPLSAFANTIRSVVNLQNKILASADLGVKGLSAVDCLALCIIAESQETSYEEMRRRLAIRKPQAERLVAALQKRGLVTAAKGAEESVSLTPAGVETHAQLESKWESWMRNNPDSRAALASIRTGVRTMQASMAAT